jgi:MFS transporter, FHS family, L-fucose permease
MPKTPARADNRFALMTVTALFFMWGFISCMNDLLIPKFKADFNLNQFQANLVQFAFFGAYFLVSLAYFLISAAKGDPINKIGYKNGLVLGLIIAGIGCLLFYPAAETKQYALFLGALIVLGSGITIIQIAANPYVTILGPEETAPSRLNLSQGLNSLGYVITPLIGGVLLFGSKDLYTSAGGVDAVKVPYVGLGIAFILLAVVFKMISLPNFRQEGKSRPGVKVFKHKHFFWGWLAIFFYVGSEVTIGSILINYLMDPGVMGMAEDTSAKFLAFYWGGTMIGRLMGAISLSNIRQSRKYLFMVLAAIGATAVIFANATFKENLTHGHFIDPMTILPYVGMVVMSFVFLRSRPLESRENGRAVRLGCDGPHRILDGLERGVRTLVHHRHRPVQLDHVVEHFQPLDPRSWQRHQPGQLAVSHDDCRRRDHAAHPRGA